MDNAVIIIMLLVFAISIAFNVYDYVCVMAILSTCDTLFSAVMWIPIIPVISCFTVSIMMKCTGPYAGLNEGGVVIDRPKGGERR